MRGSAERSEEEKGRGLTEDLSEKLKKIIIHELFLSLRALQRKSAMQGYASLDASHWDRAGPKCGTSSLDPKTLAPAAPPVIDESDDTAIFSRQIVMRGKRIDAFRAPPLPKVHVWLQT